MSLSGLVFLSGLVLFFGFMLCFLPGLYLMVPFSLVFSIMVFKGFGINQSMGYSFSLIKGNWATTFLTLILLMLIYIVCTFIVQIPTMIYMMAKVMVSTDSVDGMMSSITSWPYYLLNIMGTIFQFILSGILVVAAAFIYFSLDEKLNRTGTFEKIDNLGRNR